MMSTPSFVAIAEDGTYRHISEGEVVDASDPIVQLHPDLFVDDEVEGSVRNRKKSRRGGGRLLVGGLISFLPGPRCTRWLVLKMGTARSGLSPRRTVPGLPPLRS
jgi:hypothetical protein